MLLDRAQKAAVYLSVSLSVSTLWASGGIGWAAAAALGALTLLSWSWSPPVSERTSAAWNILLLAFIAFSVLRVVYQPLAATAAAVQLVLMLTCTKLFQRHHARDDTHLHALSFLIMALASALHRSLGLGALFVLYLLCVSVSLNLTHLRLHRDADAPSPLRLDRSYITVAAMIGLMTLTFTALGFVLLPRLGSSSLTSPDERSSTGLSDRVDLSLHGQLQLDDRVVMRVTVDQPLSQAPYWRGVVVDTFDGARWWASPTLQGRLSPPNTSLSEFSLSQRSPDAPLIRQDIELEPLTRDVLPALANPRTLTFHSDSPPLHPHSLQRDVSGSLYHTFDPSPGPTRYTVTSQPSAPSRAPLTPAERAAYLQLPSDLSPRMRQLAASLALEHSAQPDRLAAITGYVTQHHTYTLDLPRRDGDPIDHFLFEDPRGHCEFFASSSVVLLRLAGIPSRQVLGFMGGEWNSFGGYYIVRQRDAHAWVEAYLPNQGWVSVDPTPASNRPDLRNVSSPWHASLSDYLYRRWDHWLSALSSQPLLSLPKWRDLPRVLARWLWLIAPALLSLALLTWLWLYALRRRLARPLHLPLPWLLAWLLAWLTAPPASLLPWAVALLSSPLALWRYLSSTSSSAPTEATAQHTLQPFYDRLIASLRRDFSLSDDTLSLPPEALAIALSGASHPTLRAASSFIHTYAALRFGPPSPAHNPHARLKADWRALRQQWKPLPSTR